MCEQVICTDACNNAFSAMISSVIFFPHERPGQSVLYATLKWFYFLLVSYSLVCFNVVLVRAFCHSFQLNLFVGVFVLYRTRIYVTRVKCNVWTQRLFIICNFTGEGSVYFFILFAATDICVLIIFFLFLVFCNQNNTRMFRHVVCYCFSFFYSISWMFHDNISKNIIMIFRMIHIVYDTYLLMIPCNWLVDTNV